MKYDITIHKGSRFSFSMKIETMDETGNEIPLDLSTSQFSMTIKPYEGYEFVSDPESQETDISISLSDAGYVGSPVGTDGVVVIDVPAEDTLVFDYPRPGVYDLKISLPDGSVETFLYGEVKFIESISPLPSGGV